MTKRCSSWNWGNSQGAEGASAQFTAAIRHAPDNAEAHCNLGQVLKEKGQFRAALAELRRGHEFGSSHPHWSYPSARWVAECEALVKDVKAPAQTGGNPSQTKVHPDPGPGPTDPPGERK